MGRFFEVAIGIVLIFIGIGAASHVDRTGNWWILVVLLVFVMAMYRTRLRHADATPSASKGASARLDSLEARMNDLQDIILGLDDKVNRIAKKVDPPHPTAAAGERTG